MLQRKAQSTHRTPNCTALSKEETSALSPAGHRALHWNMQTSSPCDLPLASVATDAAWWPKPGTPWPQVWAKSLERCQNWAKALPVMSLLASMGALTQLWVTRLSSKTWQIWGCFDGREVTEAFSDWPKMSAFTRKKLQLQNKMKLCSVSTLPPYQAPGKTSWPSKLALAVPSWRH